MNDYKPINPNFPPVVKNLIIINALFFLATIALNRSYNIDLTDYLGMHFWQSDAFNPVQLITYMFMHSTQSYTHLLFNMFGLWMFGKNIELVWGPKKFLIYYFVAGIGAAIIQQIIWHIQLSEISYLLDSFVQTQNINVIKDNITTLQPYIGHFANKYETINLMNAMSIKQDVLSLVVTVGASGSLFGILLAFAVLFPRAEMFLLFIPYPIRAPYFVGIYALVELSLGIGGVNDGIAHFAHLGGMLGGGILLFYWYKKGKLLY